MVRCRGPDYAGSDLRLKWAESMECATASIDLEAFPGALCRIALDSGDVLERNVSAGTLIGSHGNLTGLLGRGEFDSLRAEALASSFWSEREIGTRQGRMRVRLKRRDDDEGLVALEALAPRAQTEDLDALVDLVADLRWEWDLANDSAHHYGPGLLVSGLAEGLPRSPVGLLTLVHPDDRATVEAAARDHIEGRAADFVCEYRITTGDDAWRWVESRGRVVERDAQGVALRVAGLITDVTHRRAAEADQAQLSRQVRHMQKLDALGQLTGGIAHDFNNILASVMGYAELGVMALQKGAHGAAAADTRDRLDTCLAEIRGAADRGRELIGKMLMFSRGGMAADGRAERIAAIGIIEDTVRMLRPMLPATLAVRLRLGDDVPALAVDPTQLQQLLLNLVINARDAVGENGVVTVQAQRASGGSCVCASCAQNVELGSDDVLLTVRDDGPGIPRALREKIFDPFFTTKEAGRGSGLGLSVVHGIVHEHGGHVCLDSSEEGTAITLVLPSADAPVIEDDARAAPTEIDGRGRKVLVIDDEEPIARWIATLLEENGFVADIYHDPQHALRRFAIPPDHWDLVITDQSMPGLSGVELADELLAESPDLPVVICSGYSEFVAAGDAEEFGFRAFLHKPVSGDRLLATVASVLERAPRPPNLRVVG